ncbi:MAG: hypothetical protein KDB00_04980, partial [Planctomycetales bacterium]|nr:hypothetical protein [Planctomycetales bacterium]
MLFISQLLRRFGINRAVTYAMAAKLWQIPSGAITALLLRLTFSDSDQGIYFLILTFTGLQGLADAGLLNTLLHASSHEAAGSRFDGQGFLRAGKGSRTRLAGIYRFAIRWYFAAAVVLVTVGLVAGWILLRRSGMETVGMPPLIAAMLLAGAAFALSPLVSILEGCNQIKTVNRYRLGQIVTGSIAVWAAMTLGAGLWTAAVAIAVQLGWELGLIFRYYGAFFSQLRRTVAAGFDWKSEIWPLQWRIGIQSIVYYLAFWPIYPILFDAAGAERAGQYGLTWQVISSLLMVSYAYLRTRSPEFGQLIAAGRRDQSNAAFRQVTIGSTLLLVLSTGSFCLVLYGLGLTGNEIATRVQSGFLSAGTCVWFAIAVIPIHLTQCFGMHIRSQKIDPNWRISIPANLLLAFFASWAAGLGEVKLIAAGMFAANLFSAVALGLMWL